MVNKMRGKFDKNDPEAIVARERVVSMIDAVPPVDLVASIKRAPSLRGMILGYIAEEMFEKHLPAHYAEIASSHIIKHDDHDRAINKSDRTVQYKGKQYRIQLKSMQTNSISRNRENGLLQADVQNDASDARTITLPNGSTVLTTCYARGDYDILAVPLFPFSGKWNFAYKLNRDCRSTTSNKYADIDKPFLLSTTEKIYWPLTDDWDQDIIKIINII